MQQIANQEGYWTKVLLTEQATAAAVFSSIRKAAAALKEGDIFLLTYSGHGGQLPDASADEEEDRKDETWCLYDVEVRDDQLYSAFGAFDAGVRILTVSDSCHSGTVTRLARELETMGQPVKVRTHAQSKAQGLNTWIRGRDEVAQTSRSNAEIPAVRGIPAEEQDEVYHQNRILYDLTRIMTPRAREINIESSIKLLAACKENQVALDGSRNGKFTEMLLSVWNEGRFKGNYADFMAAILQEMPQTQSCTVFDTGIPSKIFDNQQPFAI
jgi:hypothetical protein